MIEVKAADPFPEVKLVTPRRFEDERGFFCETWNRQLFAERGIDADFIQDNHSLSRRPGTVRGLHFQIAPYAQSKLVRVVRGRILDVVVDLRHGSPTFGRHLAVELSAEAGNQLFVPVGFAHGFLTLEPDTEVLYKVTNYYSAAHDKGLLWNDPALGIDWGIAPGAATVSDKDRVQPTFAQLSRHFEYRIPTHARK